jgi:crotonobetainyl-CoA:carnitine CoA-transferase CaiB-like acyl-CoA transferase
MPSVRERAAAAAEIDAAMGEWARGRSTEEAERVLRACGVPAGTVRSPLAAAEDVQIEARRLLEPLLHPSGKPTEFRGPRLPIAFTGRVDELAPAERLGTSTDVILARYLAIGDQELADLRARGVIG